METKKRRYKFLFTNSGSEEFRFGKREAKYDEEGSIKLDDKLGADAGEAGAGEKRAQREECSDRERARSGRGEKTGEREARGESWTK